MGGLFVVFEGGEGAGKSTQARRLGIALTNGGHDVVLTREPGGTPLGLRLRELLLHGDHVPAKAEALLFLADRVANVVQHIRPALDRDAVVVSERFTDSTIVYQGEARGLDASWLNGMSRWATDDLTPHLVVVLDVDPRIGLARLGGPDRIEREPLEFHDRVRAGFLRRADLGENNRRHLAAHTRYLTVDAALPEEEIARTVLEAVTPLLPRRGGAQFHAVG